MSTINSIGQERSDEVLTAPGSGRRALAPEFLSERSFALQLCQERKRAERSGRKFALMLVDAVPTFAGEGQNLWTSLLRVVSSSIRGTDVLGWHQRDVVAGVILTEFGNGEVSDALESIRYRVSAGLHGILSPSQIDAVRITFHVFPEDWDIGNRTRAIDLTLYPELPGSNGKRNGRQIIKRLVDIVGGLLALATLWPVFAVIAIAIRISSKGPALYRQERVGQFGIRFTMYKFRSMEFQAKSSIHEEYVQKFIRGRVDSASADGIFKLKDDPRVTAVGRFLRKTSLDEFPQFFNVLRGDMSLVGPRPPLPYELKSYDTWHRRRLLEAKPGLTGLWQVSGRSRTEFSEMVRLDLRYAQSQSMWLDLSLLFRTIRVLIFDEGAC